MHICTKCHRTLSRDLFHRCTNSTSGLQSHCKECTYKRLGIKKPGSRSGLTDEQRAQRRKLLAREWRQKNKDRMKEKVYEWRTENPERWREHCAKSRTKNIDKVLARNIQRSNRIRRATPQWADRKAITDLYLLAKTLGRDLGVQLDVDHIVPLNGKTVCGLHVGENLRLLPRLENIQKFNTFTEVWP